MDLVPVEHDPFGASGVVAKNFPPELNPPGDPNPLAAALLAGPQQQGPQTPPTWARKAVVDMARPFLDAGQYVGGVMAGNVEPTVADTITNLGGVAAAVASPPAARAGKVLAREAVPAAETAAQGIRGYHGSPFDFSAFDNNKIGTGEGAQAYGHGHYIAENEATARAYEEALALRHKGMTVEGVSGRRINDLNGPERQAFAMLTNDRGNIDQSIKRSSSATNADEVRSVLERWKADGRYEFPKGHMYEVNINAHPDQFLDWDKPLSEQSPHVRSVYQKLTGAADPADAAARVRSLEEQMTALGEDRDPITNQMRNEPKWHQLARDRDVAWNEWNLAQSGQKFYHNLPKVTYSIRDNAADKWRASGASTLEDAMQLVGGDKSRVLQVSTPGKEIAAQRLHQAGIPGIKYLDQGSRGSGAGTRNYVVFDPKLIDIVKKYGVAGLGAFPVGSQILYPVDNDPFAEKRAAGGRVARPKLSHLAVGYVTKSCLPGKHCAVCSMYQPDRGGPGCTLVRDPITPQGWCRRFTPKTKD